MLEGMHGKSRVVGSIKIPHSPASSRILVVELVKLSPWLANRQSMASWDNARQVPQSIGNSKVPYTCRVFGVPSGDNSLLDDSCSGGIVVE